MATPDDLRAAGQFDRLLGRISSLPGPRVTRSTRGLMDRFRRLTGPSTELSGETYRAWNTLLAEAIAASNRARAAERAGGGGAIPPAAGVGTGVEYHVIVSYIDPTTGGTNRVLVVVSSQRGLSREQIDSMAAGMGTSADHWTDSGKRGDIAPATAQFVETILIGVR